MQEDSHKSFTRHRITERLRMKLEAQSFVAVNRGLAFTVYTSMLFEEESDIKTV